MSGARGGNRSGGPVRGLRYPLRRLARLIADRIPAARRLLLRAPFSRRAALVPALFGGTDITRWRGLTLEVDVGEFEGFFKYFDRSAPEPEIEWLEARCAGARVFFDVGANQGFVALALARACPWLQVVAFEPDPANADRFRMNLGLNPDLAGRVTLVEQAVGASTGTAVFSTAEGVNSGTGALGAHGSVTRQVAVTSLADYCTSVARTPDVMKIDVEGAETDVLDGLGPLVETLAALAIEVHHDQRTASERSAFERRLTSQLGRLPLSFRYLMDERTWTEQPPQPWPKRFHAFGSRS